jgi:transglutaminase-like putative cysteine protease
MFIRIGFEITIKCVSPTPLLLALLPHPSYGGRVIGSDQVRTDPAVPQEEYLDEFANRRARAVAPVGRLTLWSDCIVENDGQPDPFDWNARQHAIADLPPETLRYLTASRYCDSDELVEQAWALFGQTPEGWARVQAICNFVHNHLTFGYQFGRPTKTATDALRERTGVCRDFAQLAVAMCRAMNIPARYVSGYLGDIGVPLQRPRRFLRLVRGLSREPLVHLRCALQHAADRSGAGGPGPRCRGRGHDHVFRRLRSEALPGVDRRSGRDEPPTPSAWPCWRACRIRRP